jgi:hypothetical protein
VQAHFLPALWARPVFIPAFTPRNAVLSIIRNTIWRDTKEVEYYLVVSTRVRLYAAALLDNMHV